MWGPFYNFFSFLHFSQRLWLNAVYVEIERGMGVVGEGGYKHHTLIMFFFSKPIEA